MGKPVARSVCATLLISALSLARGAASEPVPDPTSHLTVIRNARLVTMTERGVLGGMALVVRGDRIDRIVPQVEWNDAAGANQIDAKGGYIVPGYVDAHVHYRHPDELLNYLAYGVTTVVSLGGPRPRSRDLLRLRDAISSGQMVGPRVYATAGIVAETVQIETADAARSYVRQLAADGFDLVKVYNEVSREVFDAIVDQGRRSGLSVFGHIPRNCPAAYSLSHGLDVVAHAEEFYFTYFGGARDRDLKSFRPTQLPDLDKTAGLIELLLEHDVAVIPNLGGGFAHMVFYDDDETAFADPELRYLHPRITNQWRSMNILQREPLDKRMLRERIKYSLTHEITRRMFDAGVLIVTGTDAAMPNVPPGKSLHRELRELVKTGLTYEQSLAATTREAGEFVRRFVDDRARIGVLREGYEADLVLLTDDPLENIRNATHIGGVMSDGRWYSAAAIQATRQTRAIRYEALEALGADVKRAVSAKAPHAGVAGLMARRGGNDADTRDYVENLIEGLAFEAFSRGDIEDVVRVTTLNTQLFPDSPNAWDTLGEVYLHLDKPEEALQSYQRALAADPGFEHAREQIDRIRKP